MLFLAYTGLRFGEMAALRVGRLDFTRRRAVIAESVAVFLIDELREHVAGKDHRDLVFVGSRSAGAPRGPAFHNSAFAAAAIAIGKSGLHPHELRHTAASLAIASGAEVLQAQR